MKRRYKAGDWIRIPLGGEHDAVALIARACRSRLFGYFFAIDASHASSHDELRGLRPGNALCALLFGGAPIEQGRWEIAATSLAFDPRAWPFPDFVSRGAFGDSWTSVRYDEQLQITARESVDAATAASLPDARFADAHEVETLLRNRIRGVPGTSSYSVCELRSPLDHRRLNALERGGRVQFSTHLSAEDFETLARFIEKHPHVELRVHGFRHGFDASLIARLPALEDLTLDVRALQHADALRELQSLRVLRIGSVQTNLRFLSELGRLERLELRGTRADMEPVRTLPALRDLVLEGTAPVPFAGLASGALLESLMLAHGAYDLRGLAALRNLRSLELRSLDAQALSELAHLDRLTHLRLVDLHGVRDLSPVALLPALRVLHLAEMPQLNVPDFAPLQRCAGLQLTVEIGSRRKEREIYRLMQAGNTYQL